MWIWIVGSIALVIALVFVIGSLLPEEYTAKGSVEIARSPSEIWSDLVDFEKHPMAAKMARAVEVLPRENGLPVWVEDLGSSKVRVTTTLQREPEPEQNHEPGELRREMKDSVVAMTAATVFRVEAVCSSESQSACRVHIDHKIRVARGTWHTPVFRVMLSLFGGARSGMRGFFKQFAGEGASYSWA